MPIDDAFVDDAFVDKNRREVHRLVVCSCVDESDHTGTGTGS